MTYRPLSVFSHQPYSYPSFPSSFPQSSSPSLLVGDRFPFLNGAFPRVSAPERPSRTIGSAALTGGERRTQFVANQRFLQNDVFQLAVTAARESNWDMLQALLSDFRSKAWNVPSEAAYEIIRACDRGRQFSLAQEAYALTPTSESSLSAFLFAAGHAGEFDIGGQVFIQTCNDSELSRKVLSPEVYTRYVRMLQDKQTKFPEKICLQDFQDVFNKAVSTQSTKCEFVKAYLYALIPFNQTEEGKQEIERAYSVGNANAQNRQNRSLLAAYKRAKNATPEEDKEYRAFRSRGFSGNDASPPFS